LERIDESAFRGSGLKSIVIPRNAISIDGSAFEGTSVRFHQ
jgi:hypothetical protein